MAHPQRAGRTGCPDGHSHEVAGSDIPAAQRWQLPHGLILVLAVAGLLVMFLAVKQFASIVAPVLLALVLVIGVHPLTGILRRRGVPLWLAVTVTLITLVVVILSLAAALALSLAQLATILPTYEDRFAE